MDNLSAQQKLMGNMQATSAELLSGIKEKCVGDPAAEVCIVPEDVAALLALLKIARIATGHGKSDNWVDLAGYAACGGELQSRPAVCGK